MNALFFVPPFQGLDLFACIPGRCPGLAWAAPLALMQPTPLVLMQPTPLALMQPTPLVLMQPAPLALNSRRVQAA